MSNGDSDGGGGGSYEGGENSQVQDVGVSSGAGVDGFNFLATGVSYEDDSYQGSATGDESGSEAAEQNTTSEQISGDDSGVEEGFGETEVSDLDSYENLDESEQSSDIDSRIENSISDESTVSEAETINSGVEPDFPQQEAQPVNDDTFLGESMNAIKEDNIRNAGITPESLMRESDSSNGSWSPHGEPDKRLNESFDPRERLASRGDELLQKNKIEREYRQETVKDNLRETQSDFTHIKQEKVSDQYENQETKQGTFTDLPQDNVLNKRGGGSAVSSADYLPKAEGGGHSNEKRSIKSGDNALMGSSPAQMRIEMISAWNEKAVRSYKERLLEDPGAAGDLARSQYTLEHPGAS